MVVRLVLERAVSDVATVFLPMVRAWQNMAERYSDDELRLIVEFYGQMEEVLRFWRAVLKGGEGEWEGMIDWLRSTSCCPR